MTQAPRNPRADALYALLWLLGRLPLAWLQRAGALLGAVARHLDLREARVARRSLALCLPELDEAARHALWRRNLAETGRTLTETLRFWTHPAERNLRAVAAVEGQAHLQAALAAGRGVIIAAPHLGNWELLNQWLATQAALAIVYRPPRRAWMDALYRRARRQPGLIQVRAEAAGMRALLRHLQGGGMAGILPDQQPKRGDGVFAPFFGIPALTMSLLPRLAQRTGATVLTAVAERRPDGRFHIRVQPAPAAIALPDPQQGARHLNAALEACIRRAPAQYQWSYKRFTIRPQGAEPILYD